jgi:23S rRNA (cytidine1920-2'-O)/16S rRNA (cytidine1409-2'-O)-methyltransferase
LARKARSGLRRLDAAVTHAFPELQDPLAAISEGQVLVDGLVATNPARLVDRDVSIALRRPTELRGSPKLAAALAAFDVRVEGRIALDLGASAGGFVRVLLEHGARRVYAVDVGHGQLLGSLRQERRVVNLERTNLADLSVDLLPDAVSLVTVDLSYLSLTRAVPQLSHLRFEKDAEMVALVKPMFELSLPAPPDDEFSLREAVERAQSGLADAGWHPLGVIDSPVRGAGGATEYLLHAQRP